MSYIRGNIVGAVEKTLKDFGIDWILEERGTKFALNVDQKRNKK